MLTSNVKHCRFSRRIYNFFYGSKKKPPLLQIIEQSLLWFISKPNLFLLGFFPVSIFLLAFFYGNVITIKCTSSDLTISRDE